MSLTRDLSLVFGALLGIAAVYIMPSTCNYPKEDKNSNKNSQNPEIIVQDPDNNIIHAEVHSANDRLKFGEATVLDIINMMKNEISAIMDYTAGRLFVPDATSSNTTSNDKDEDPRVAASDEYATAMDSIIDPNDPGFDASTIYVNLPNKDAHAPTQQAKKTPDTGIESKGEFDAPTGQSTLIDLSKNENIKNGFIVSFKNSKSPIRGVFRRMLNILRFKNNASQNNSKIQKSKGPPTILIKSDYRKSNGHNICLKF